MDCEHRLPLLRWGGRLRRGAARESSACARPGCSLDRGIGPVASRACVRRRPRSCAPRGPASGTLERSAAKRRRRFCRWVRTWISTASCGTAVELGASDVHLKVGQPPIIRHDGDLEPARGLGRRSTRRSSSTIVEHDRRVRPRAARRVLRDGRARHRLPGRRPAALPRQRVPPARRDLVRVPRHPERGAELREPRASRRASRGSPSSTTASILVTGATGAGKTTTLAVDDRPHQPDAPAAHRHDRGPDRDPPRRRAAASSTSARSGSTPPRSTRRCAARSGRTPT